MSENVSEISNSQSTSRTLLERARARESDAWRQLADLYGIVVYQWCREARLQGADAADVVQEVFRSVFTSLERFDITQPGGTFRGWLWTITRTKLQDHWRRHSKQPPTLAGSAAEQVLASAEDPFPSGEASFMSLESLPRRALEQIESQFDPCTWQAFWRLAIDGHSAAEIGQDLGLSTAAVRQAKFRVIRRLRDELRGMID